MSKIAVALALLVACILAAPVHAQNNRSFISGMGSDSNPCTFGAPCRTAQRAHDVTNAQGEINVLDPAGYGPLTITKAISVQGHGWGELAAPLSANAVVTINAPGGDDVILDGLVIEGFTGGSVGVLFQSGASLNVQNCMIRNAGVDRAFSFVPTGGSHLTISNTVFSRFLSPNGTNVIVVEPSGPSPVQAVFDHVQVFQAPGGAGIALINNSTFPLEATISNSVMDTVQDGIVSRSLTGSPTTVTVVNSVVTHSTQHGLLVAGQGAKMQVSRSTIVNNNISLLTATGGTLLSYGDNNIDANTTNALPTNTLALH